MIKLFLFIIFLIVAGYDFYKIFSLMSKSFSDIKPKDHFHLANVSLVLFFISLSLIVFQTNTFGVCAWIFNAGVWFWNFTMWRKRGNDLLEKEVMKEFENFKKLNKKTESQKKAEKIKETRMKKLQRIFKSKKL